MEEKISHCLHYLLHRHRPMGSGRSIRWATEVVSLFPRQRGRPSSLRTNRALSPSLPPSPPPVRPSVRRLSIILIGGSAEGSDGQMRARSPSLPQRQQRRSCVLLPTSSCSAARLPPSPAGPSLLSSFPPPPPCPSPARSQWRASAVSRKGDVPFGCGNIKAETRDEETCHRGRSGCVRERLHFISRVSRVRVGLCNT